MHALRQVASQSEDYERRIQIKIDLYTYNINNSNI